MRMSTVVNSSNPEVTTPTSYVSRWIAQSQSPYQKKPNEYYSPSSSPSPSSSSSSYEYRTPTTSLKTSSILIPPTTKQTILKPHTTTWQAQAKLQSEATAAAAASANIYDCSTPSRINIDNNELQEKLNRIRILLDAKRQRLCRHLTLSSSSSSTLPDHPVPSTIQLKQSSTTSILGIENVYLSHDESHVYHSPSILPCLMEESPSDSGISDGAKTANNDDIIDSTNKNPAIIDLSKPLSKEEMLAIIQILRELWRKQFGSEIPDIKIKTTVNSIDNRPISNGNSTSYLLNNTKDQYHSTPALNKLSAELSDIKDKLKRFSNGRNNLIDEKKRQQISDDIKSSLELNNIEINGDSLVFIPLGPPLTCEDIERMQMKKNALIRRQIQRREQQLIRRNQRLTKAIEQQNEYNIYEKYLAQKRQEDNHRRKTILQAHIEQKRLEADPPSSHDYYFAAAKNRNRLRRKASMTSFVSFDDNNSLGGSTFDLFSTNSGKKNQTTKRNPTRFDLMSPSLTASTTASRSKMNRAASTCNVNQHYDSFTSLNSKATIPIMKSARTTSRLLGGSLMNISTINNKKRQQEQILDEPFDLTADSPLSGSLSSINLSTPPVSRLARSQTHLSTKSNKQTILNAIRQVVLAGPTNEQQRETLNREIDLCEARHFIILFRDHRLQFRAVYMYIPDTDIIEKVHGIGPNIITEVMVEKWYKYNSGGKRFTNIPIRHFSIQCDAIIIHNDFWQKKILTHMNKLH